MSVMAPLAIGLWFLIACAYAQSCGSLVTQKSQCDSVLSYTSIYLPPGVDSLDIDAIVADNLGPISFDLVPQQCIDAAYTFACSNAFRECHDLGSVIIPSPPCYSTCEAYVNECGALLSLFGLDSRLPDCSAESPTFAPLPEFPDGDMDIPGVPILIPCTAPVIAEPIEVTSFQEQLPGSCQPFTSAPNSGCDAVITPGTSVFVPTGGSIAVLDALAAEKTGAFLLGLSSSACTDNAFAFICASAFRQCTEFPLPVGDLVVGLPSPPCRSTCEDFDGSCADFLSSLGQPLPNCSENGEDGNPLYPTDEAVFSVIPGVLEYSVECAAPITTGDVGGIPIATCQSPELTTFPNSQCQSVVNYPVYVPEGLSLSALDAAAGAIITPTLIGLVGDECRVNAMPFICGLYFRPCSYHEILPGVEEPPCRNTCDSFIDTCSSEPAFAANADLLPSCDALSPTTGLPDYPEEAINVPLGENTLVVQCSSHVDFVASYRYFPKATCEKMETTVYSQCSRVLKSDEDTDWRVFVPEGSSQKKLDFSAHRQSFALMWEIIEQDCSAAAARFICSGTFLGCVSAELAPGLNLVVPRAPCAETCREFNFYCEATLLDAGRELTDCSTLSDDPLVIPVSESIIVNAPCVYPDRDVAISRQCPPRTYPDDDDDDDVCLLECPNPQFSESQYISYFWVTTILGFLGIFCGLTTWICFMCHPWKRQYPRSNPAWQQLYTVPLSAAYILPALSGGLENAWCKDNIAVQRGDTWYCVLNAWMLYFGAWSASLWYCYVGLALLITVTNLPIPYLVIQITFHSVGIIFPLAWLTILTLTDDFVNGGYGGCRIDNYQWNEYFQDVWFWFPYTILLLAALFFLFLVVIQLIRIMGFVGVREHWRIIAYLLYGLLTVGYTCVYHWVVRLEEDSIVRNVQAWAVCLATTLEYDRCKLTGALNFEPYFANIIIVQLVPVVFAIILLSDPELYLYWIDIFRRKVLHQDVPDRWAAQKRTEAISRRLTNLEGSVSHGGASMWSSSMSGTSGD